MDKNQYAALVEWAERGAKAEQEIAGRSDGPFFNIAEGLKGFDHGAPDTQEKRDEYLDRTMYAANAMAEQIALYARIGLANKQHQADMMAYAGILLALELAKRVADAGLNIEIAG